MSKVLRYVRPGKYPRVAIICTIGPAIWQPIQVSKGKFTAYMGPLRRLAREGMCAARINFSHVKPADFPKIRFLISQIRQIENELRTPIPIIMDLKGPEIRVSDIMVQQDRKGDKEEAIDGKIAAKLIKDDCVTLSQSRGLPSRNQVAWITLDCPFRFWRYVKPRQSVVVGDNDLYLTVERVNRLKGEVVCKAKHRGRIRSGQGVNLPDNSLDDVPALRADAEALEHGFDVDFIAQSFVRSARDILTLAKFRELAPILKNVPIIAKIETQSGVDNIESILARKEVFGIMVARGDLGVLVDFRKLPQVQRDLITAANISGKPVIVATQVLESMIDRPKPWRPEVEGISVAICQGADGLMLAGETAKGDFALESVRVAKEVIEGTQLDREDYLSKFPKRGETTPRSRPIDSIGLAICKVAEEANSPYIFSYATMGTSATRISKFRPEAPIVAITLNEKLARQLRLLYNVCPVLVDPKTMRDVSPVTGKPDFPRQTKEFIAFLEEIMSELRLKKPKRNQFLVGTQETKNITGKNPRTVGPKSRGIFVFEY